ncbi:hypothetical protein HDU85_002213 [Gaertneriomyces sp. JEL0708]|nr:hypothetical protein HDU85_002213 [Gaertneriomyces sp. JEL0708]
MTPAIRLSPDSQIAKEKFLFRVTAEKAILRPYASAMADELFQAQHGDNGKESVRAEKISLWVHDREGAKDWELLELVRLNVLMAQTVMKTIESEPVSSAKGTFTEWHMLKGRLTDVGRF